MCSCHLAPLSGIIHTIRATHSQHHALFNSYKMVRSPDLYSHLLTHRRLMVLLLQGFVSSPLLQRSAISSQVPACPTRNVTGDVMPLAEAITQLSFLEFLQRCGMPIAPPQPLPVPISLLDAAVQTTPSCDATQDVSTQTSDQLVSSLSFPTLQCRRLPTVFTPHLWMRPRRRSHTVLLSQHVFTQIGSRSASSFSVDVFVQTPIRSTVLHDVATQLPLTEFFIRCIFSNDRLDRQNFDRQSPVIGTRRYW